MRGPIYTTQLPPVCFQCPSRTWLSCSSLKPRYHQFTLTPDLLFLLVWLWRFVDPFHASPLDHCHCGCGQLTGVAVVCSSRPFPHIWIKFLPGTRAINPCCSLALDLVLEFFSSRFCDLFLKSAWSDLTAGLAWSRWLEERWSPLQAELCSKPILWLMTSLKNRKQCLKTQIFNFGLIWNSLF